MRRLITITLPCLFLMLVGCGTTPNPRFYALTGAPAPPAASSTMSVSVGPVTIPAAVDRPQIVLTTAPNRVRLEEFDRWAAPLQTTSPEPSRPIWSPRWGRPASCWRPHR